MRISTIPQIYRHVNRWGEILAVLSKYELGAWIGRIGPEAVKDVLKARGGAAIARLPWETRVRMALAELGPTFIKLGQLLSTRPDLVGVALADELQNLQTNVPADPPEVVAALLEAEFRKPLNELFAEFDLQAHASASIGQVHLARLPNGQRVVVKLQRADIQRKVAVDLDILAGLAQWADRLPEFHIYRPRGIVAEFHRTLRRELDFSRELWYLEQFGRFFEGYPYVRIPRAYADLSSHRVLTMELVEGVKFSQLPAAAPPAFDPVETARRGADVYCKMIFCHGLYHADPHPGNLLLMDDGRIGLLDFGMVGRMDEGLHELVGELLLAVTDQDPEQLTALLVRIGHAPKQLDRSALSADVADFVSLYGHQSLEKFDLAGALRDLTEMIRRYSIVLPPSLALLLKVVITLEGTSRLVCPRFSLIEVMQPYHRTIFWRRYSPRRRMRKARRAMGELERLLESLPRSLSEIMQQVQSGTFDVHLDHRGLEPSVNRLVLGMLSSALFLSSALLLSHKVPPTPFGFGVSAPGLAGLVVAVWLGWRLWVAISRSGKLDRPRE
ncbi:MAG: ABC1 kinase family protein [Planctomycetota bacterium]